jgi:transcriptional regulator with XRE-family HTH domain
MLAVGKQAELMNKLDVGTAVGSFGDFVRERRRSAQLSLRQLAEQTGVSNPYLSQIERGLRKPSAHVLQQLAKALRVSAETMYVRAGMLDPDEDGARSVELAVLSDIGLTERQKTVLLDIYSSFRREVADAAQITEPSAEATHATDEVDG